MGTVGPVLHHNLLSVLLLTKQRTFKVHIDADHMCFILDGDRFLVASINDDHSTFLDGNTQSHPESAQITSTQEVMGQCMIPAIVQPHGNII